MEDGEQSPPSRHNEQMNVGTTADGDEGNAQTQPEKAAATQDQSTTALQGDEAEVPHASTDDGHDAAPGKSAPSEDSAPSVSSDAPVPSPASNEPTVEPRTQVAGSDESILDVLIVGAGLSGLTAAYTLKKKGIENVEIVEANDRIGGRSNSTELKTALGTKKFDTGGQWVGSTQLNITSLAEELDCRIIKQYTDGKKVLLFPDGKTSLYSNTIPPVSAVGLVKLQLLLNKLDKMMVQVPLDDPTKCKHAEKWDNTSVHGFLQQNNVKYGNETLRHVLQTATRTIFGCELNSMSLLWFLHYCHSAGGFMRLADTEEGSAQHSVLHDCSHNLCLKLADKIGRDRITLADPVVAVEQNEADEIVMVTCTSGRTIKCRRVIITVPYHLQDRITFSPRLPTSLKTFTMQQSPGHLIKFIVTYQTAFWREAGMSGEIVAMSNPLADDDDQKERTAGCSPMAQSRSQSTHNENTLSAVFDVSKEDEAGFHPALVGLAGGIQAVYQSQLKEDELKTKILADLAHCLGEKALEPIDFVIQDWHKEPWAGGCPVSFSITGALTNYSKRAIKPFGRIHWAGTETSRVWRGYLDGAVASGKRVAEEIPLPSGAE
eukprot:scpid52888/ scgid5829/ Probable flavin-containing monoamine oxidase A